MKLICSQMCWKNLFHTSFDMASSILNQPELTVRGNISAVIPGRRIKTKETRQTLRRYLLNNPLIDSVKGIPRGVPLSLLYTLLQYYAILWMLKWVNCRYFFEQPSPLFPGGREYLLIVFKNPYPKSRVIRFI